MWQRLTTTWHLLNCLHWSLTLKQQSTKFNRRYINQKEKRGESYCSYLKKEIENRIACCSNTLVKMQSSVGNLCVTLCKAEKEISNGRLHNSNKPEWEVQLSTVWKTVISSHKVHSYRWLFVLAFENSIIGERFLATGRHVEKKNQRSQGGK